MSLETDDFGKPVFLDNSRLVKPLSCGLKARKMLIPLASVVANRGSLFSGVLILLQCVG